MAKRRRTGHDDSHLLAMLAHGVPLLEAIKRSGLPPTTAHRFVRQPAFKRRLEAAQNERRTGAMAQNGS